MSGKSTAFSTNQTLNCRGKLLDLKEPKIMGVLNLTPDSFFDGGRNLKDNFFLTKAEELVTEGAAILDIGAATTKPGSKLIDADKEWNILEQPLKLLKKRYSNIIFSIDTYNASTAQRVADIGIEMINDISGGSIDDKMFEVICKNKMAYVLMHIHGTPENMQQNPVNGNVVDNVLGFFEKKLKILQACGLEDILLDPGFGFGKTLDQNYKLLKELDEFKQFNLPVLVGLSRKSMIFKQLETNPEEALNGTSVLNTIALLNGAKILRVHDVREASETISLFLKYKQF